MTDIPVDNQIDDKTKEILVASQALDTALDMKFKLEKELIEIKEQCRKGKFNLARLKEERASLIREFWRNKER